MAMYDVTDILHELKKFREDNGLNYSQKQLLNKLMRDVNELHIALAGEPDKEDTVRRIVKNGLCCGVSGDVISIQKTIDSDPLFTGSPSECEEWLDDHNGV